MNRWNLVATAAVASTLSLGLALSGPAGADSHHGSAAGLDQTVAIEITPGRWSGEDSFYEAGSLAVLSWSPVPYDAQTAKARATWTDTEGWLTADPATGREVELEVPYDAPDGLRTEVTLTLTSSSGVAMGQQRIAITVGEPDREVSVTGPAGLENREWGHFSASLDTAATSRWYDEGHANCERRPDGAMALDVRCVGSGPTHSLLLVTRTEEVFPSVYVAHVEFDLPRDTVTFALADVHPVRDDPLSRDLAFKMGTCWDITCQPIDGKSDSFLAGIRGATVDVQRRVGSRPWVTIGSPRTNAKGIAWFLDDDRLKARPSYRVVYAGSPLNDPATAAAPVTFGARMKGRLQGRVLTGKVTFMWGAPVAGVKVTLLHRTAGTMDRAIARGRTDARGVVRFKGIPNGTASMQANFIGKSLIRTAWGSRVTTPGFLVR